MPDETVPLPPDTAPVGTTRVVAPRRARPSPRAALGALLVCLAVGATLLVQHRAEAGPDAAYLVAAEAVPAGVVLGADDVTPVDVDLPPELARHAYADPASLSGAVTTEPLEAGELIEEGDVLRPRPGQELDPPPHHDVTLLLDRDRALAGDLAAGDRVDLLATYGTDRDAQTIPVALDARVVAIDSGGDTLAASGLVTITLSVSDPDVALRVAHAAEVAAVRLVRRIGPTSPSDAGYHGPGNEAESDR